MREGMMHDATRMRLTIGKNEAIADVNDTFGVFGDVRFVRDEDDRAAVFFD
jgi:hypothetical protein